MIADELVSDDDGCRLRIGTDELTMSWRWLRDHARDDGSYLRDAQQRIVSPADVAAAGVGTATLDDDGGRLEVSWPDGCTSTWTIDWLARTSGDAMAATEVTGLVGEPRSWTGRELAARLVRLDAATISTDDGLVTGTRSPTTRRCSSRSASGRETWSCSTTGGSCTDVVRFVVNGSSPAATSTGRTWNPPPAAS